MTIRLKLLRKQKGWSLEVLAELTGLTKSYLSKVERGVSVPSIAVALKLSKALGVEVGDLFSEARNREAVVITRAAQRTRIGDPKSSARKVEGIATEVAPKRMLPFVAWLSAEFSASGYKEHEGEELLFVHRGAIELEFPNETVRLDEGDSVYFNALIPHRMRSVGPVQAEVLVVVSNDEEDGA